MQSLALSRFRILFMPLLMLAWLAAIAASPSPLAHAGEKHAPGDSNVDLSRVEAVDVDAIFAGEVPSDLNELRAMQEHIQELSEKIIPYTVGLQVGGAQGSGVIISADGYILTAAHVIGRAGRPVTFILEDGSTVQGKSLGLCHRLDSGLAKITDDPPEGGWPFAEVGNSEWLARGQWVISTGHPGGYEPGRRPVVRVGRIMSARPSVLRTDCTLVGGDSGGPLFDMTGRVVGIHSRIGGSLSSNMHVPTDLYSDSWERMERGDTWGDDDEDAPYVGIVGADDTFGPAEVVDVVRDSPAEEAGLRGGDIILKLNDIEITSLMRLMSVATCLSPEDVAVLTVQREDETITLDLTIGSR